MEIKMLEKRSIPLGSGATQSYPAGWEGGVPDEYAADWVNEGAAELIGGVVAPFTELERSVLKDAAGEIIAAALAGQAAQAEAELALGDLDHEELLDLAHKAGLEDADELEEGDLRALLASSLAALATDDLPEDVEAGDNEAYEPLVEEVAAEDVSDSEDTVPANEDTKSDDEKDK